MGADPSGLIMAKLLSQTNLNFRIFERSADVGGIWNLDAPNSPVYESTHFICSGALSRFRGFPMPADYPSHRQILAYIKSYAAKFDLHRHVRFNGEIERVRQQADGAWQLKLGNGETVSAKYLVCANGVTWIPTIVEWKGEFNGRPGLYMYVFPE